METPSYDQVNTWEFTPWRIIMRTMLMRFGQILGKMLIVCQMLFQPLWGMKLSRSPRDTQEEVEEVSQYVHKKQGGQ